MDDEWVDIVGTNGIRVSIPSVLAQVDILPDDVLSIEVRRDDLKTARRRQGNLKVSLIDRFILSDDSKEVYEATHNNAARKGSQCCSNILEFPRDRRSIMDKGTCTFLSRKTRAESAILRRYRILVRSLSDLRRLN